jgi:hypothetical protein
MKKISFRALLAISVVFLPAVVFAAADQAAAPADIGKLNDAIAQINVQARGPQAEALIEKQLERDFSVSSRKIKALHQGKMEYGDMAAALALAEKLPGGITNHNLNEVTRGKNRATWDQVAAFFKIDLGSAAERVSGVQDNIVTALAGAGAGSAAGGAGTTP